VTYVIACQCRAGPQLHVLLMQEQSVVAHGATGRAAGASSFGMSGVNAHGIFTGNFRCLLIILCRTL
jgi:hypothetical protein